MQDTKAIEITFAGDDGVQRFVLIGPADLGTAWHGGSFGTRDTLKANTPIKSTGHDTKSFQGLFLYPRSIAVGREDIVRVAHARLLHPRASRVKIVLAAILFPASGLSPDPCFFWRLPAQARGKVARPPEKALLGEEQALRKSAP
jgi:hypothetical protein